MLKTSFVARIAGGVAALAIVIAGVGVAAPASAVADKDCGDFSTQAEAQRFFEAAGPGDPHRLDADDDGIACESNPCPCAKPGSSSGGGGKGGSSSNGSGSSKSSSKKVVTTKATVKSVIDGDTIKVRAGGKVYRVRLLGIDTPEIGSRKECGGVSAANSMKRMLKPGDKVTLKSDPSQSKKDKYGRLLRYVYEKGTDVGRTQITRGWAEPYVVKKASSKKASYEKAAKKAKSAGVGVWDVCDGF